MKKNAVTQEILLMTSSSFIQREWCEKDTPQARALSAVEKIEEACWNGFLYELLPGVIETPARGKKLFLWQIIACNSFLESDLGVSPVHSHYVFSINPYFFLNGRLNN